MKKYQRKSPARHTAAIRSIDKVHESVATMKRVCQRSLKTITPEEMEQLTKRLAEVTNELEKTLTPLIWEVTNVGLGFVDEAKERVMTLQPQSVKATENNADGH